MASEVGSAYLSILPSFQGGARSIAQQLNGPMGMAGRQGGMQYAGGVAAGGRSSFMASGAKMGGIFAAAFAAVGLGNIAGQVKDYLLDAIGSASDLSETQAKTGEIFGDSTASVLRFARQGASALGQSEQTVLDGASTFGIFGQSAGLAGEDLAGFSTEMVTLATDLASFNNTSTTDAIDAIGAALRGEAEPMRRYGVLLDDATLKARAMEMGIYDGNGALTAQQKVLAAQQEMLAQTTTQQGDFARTSEGYANQQRILNAHLENFTATVGTALLPVVTDLVSLFVDEAVPALEDLRKWIGKNEDGIRTFVIAMVDGGLAIVEAVLIMMDIWATWNKTMINIFADVGIAFWALGDTILTAAEKAFGWMPGIGPKLAEMRAGFDLAKANADVNFRAMRAGADKVASSVRGARDAVSQLRDKVKALDGATANVKVKIVQTGSVPSPASFTGGVGKRASGGPVVAGMPYLVGEMGPEIVVPRVSGAVVSATGTAAAMGGGQVDLTDRSIAGIGRTVLAGINAGISEAERATYQAGRVVL